MSPVFKLEKLNKHYLDGSGNKLEILKDIEISFEERKTISIVGASGSGKSTLLNLLGGLDRPTAGSIFFKGENISDFSSNALSEWRNRRIGFIFQAHHLLPDFTALENITIPALIAEIPIHDYLDDAKDLLEQVGLKDRMTHKPGQLSGGEQQRIAIARALINRPDVILADEPTGNLDNKTGEKVSRLLLDISAKRNATLITVTHNSRLASSMEIQLRLFDGKLSPQ